MRNTVTELLKAETAPARSQGADLTFVLSVMQAVEKRRLYVQTARLAIFGLLATLVLAVIAPWLDAIIAPLQPALPALVATASGLFVLYVLRKETPLFR